MILDKLDNRLVLVLLVHSAAHVEADVWSVERTDENLVLAYSQPKLRDYVLARSLVGGGGESHNRHVWETFVQRTQFCVFGTEIVSPLRYAVSLVNGKERYVYIP